MKRLSRQSETAKQINFIKFSLPIRLCSVFYVRINVVTLTDAFELIFTLAVSDSISLPLIQNLSLRVCVLLPKIERKYLNKYVFLIFSFLHLFDSKPKKSIRIWRCAMCTDEELSFVDAWSRVNSVKLTKCVKLPWKIGSGLN